MGVPSDSHQMLRAGVDGTVQQCCVTFRFGNLHEQRLSNMLYTVEHRHAARESFQPNCPNRHCGYDMLVERHGPSAARYR